MASGDTRELIRTALGHLGDEVPALKQLKLTVRLELPIHGDAAVWRVALPGPEISRDPAGDARVDVSVPRAYFNELADKGRLRDWISAYERGHVRVSGDAAVIKLIGNVIARQSARTR